MSALSTALLVAALAAPSSGTTTVSLEPSRDATLIESAAGDLANGAGPSFFVGRNGQSQDSIRRGLLHFDLSSIPPHARIESVRLTLYVNQATPRPGSIGAHRALAPWGEGPSFSNGGGGAPAAPGDATWLDRYYDPFASAPPPPQAKAWGVRDVWRSPGGDFEPAASASITVGGTGTFVLEGGALAADVQRWVRNPRHNDGWVLVGDESQSSTARRVSSREDVMPERHPRLEIVYSSRPQP